MKHKFSIYLLDESNSNAFTVVTGNLKSIKCFFAKITSLRLNYFLTSYLLKIFKYVLVLEKTCYQMTKIFAIHIQIMCML